MSPVALCYIEHDGESYSYGDEVPDEVAEAHPNAVGEVPLSDDAIDGMSRDQLAALLKEQR